MRGWFHIVTMIAACPLLAFGPAERTASTHWALLVGISDYIHFDDVEGGDLPGAEHDALGMRDFLVMRRGFPEQNVRLLLNHEATREAIRESVTGWLASNARPGDNVVVFFAGHGSQMWDESGDEDDGLDETIAPADVVASSTEADISDDELGEWLGTLATDNVVVVLDNCNSGTGTRDVTPFSRARLLARDIDDLPRPAAAARRALPGQRDESGFDVGGTRVLELAAAQPFQVAVDAYFPATDGAEAFHGGAFTTFLLQELWRAPSDATYEDVFENAYQALKRNRFQQDPYISPDVSLRDQPVFSVEGAQHDASEMTLPVVGVGDTRVQLAGGVALGITPGSVFRTEGGARLVVASVTQRWSFADVAAGTVDDGDQARLVAHRFARTPLLVNVAALDARVAEALGSTLADVASVRLVHEDGAFGHLVLRRRGEEIRVVGADGFIRHDGIDAAPTAMAELSELLRKEAAAKTLGDMENPAQPFGLAVELEGGRTSFGLGADISFGVESERDGYLTLLDLGTDGTVAMLLPNAGSPSVPVTAGRRVSFPENDLVFEVQPPVGSGMVRAFVTPEPLDIEIPPGSEYAYGGEDFATRVTEALIEAAGRDGEAVRLDSWASASIVYEIHN